MPRPRSETQHTARSPAPHTPPDVATPWAPATRIAFRFCVLYLGLFALATQLTGSLLPNLSVYYRGLGRLWPLRDVTIWIAQHIVGTSIPADEVTAGGEPLFFWIQTGWILALAGCGTALWSFLDRRRQEYSAAHAWFRLAIRFVLAASMFEYGMTKIIPTQFPAPSLETLVTPAGDLTLSASLWTTIGASPAYEIFTGCVEVLGGLLLLLPRTTLLGALVCLGAAAQVFALNMGFDIGLKLISFHLVLLALFLIAPDAPRLIDLLIRQRPATPRIERPLMRSPQAQRMLVIVQLLAGAYLVGMYTFINVRFWHVGGGGKPRSALYGIWNVEQMAIDGDTRSPLLNDYDRRWRRVLFDEPDRVTVQRTDDSFVHYATSLDTSGKTMELRKAQSRLWRAQFTLQQPASDQLRLEGTMDGQRLELQLRRVNEDTFRLLNSSFRWVRPHEGKQ